MDQLNREQEAAFDENMEIPLIEIPQNSTGWPNQVGEEPDQMELGASPADSQQVDDVTDPAEFEEPYVDNTSIKSNSRRRKVIVATTTAACMMLLVSLAWYLYISHRSVYTEDRSVMVPYYLYLLDGSGSDYFQLNEVNIHPEETKQVVFCVSNQDIDKDLSYSVGRSSDFKYELEMVYTQNIPLKYTLYELDEVTPSDLENLSSDVIVTQYEKETEENGVIVPITETKYWEKRKTNSVTVPLARDETVSDNETANNNKELYTDNYQTSNIVNLGKYDIYPKDAGGEDLHLETVFNGTATEYPKHYYLIEIEWDKDSESSFSDYLKETDLVYVVVRAMQPRPEETTDTSTP